MNGLRKHRPVAWGLLSTLFLVGGTTGPAAAGEAFNCSVAGPPEPGIVFRIDGGAARATYRVDGVGEGALFLQVPVDLTTDGSGSAMARVEAACSARGTGRTRLTLSARGDQPLTCELCFECDGIGTSPHEVGCVSGASGGAEPGSADCVSLRKVSEEDPPVQCPAGYLVRGMGCNGQYCDDKQLTCCRYRSGEGDAIGCHQGPYSISEEPPQNRFFTESGFLCGLGCSGRYCDWVRAWTLDDPILGNTGNCFEAPFISEEVPGSYRECPVGWWVAGLICKGRYCDSLSLICCEATGATVVDH